MARVAHGRRLLLAGWFAALMAHSPERSARGDTLEVEVPMLVPEEAQPGEESLGEETDLSQMVVSSAKRIESVQESASIVSVVTRDQIVDHGYLGLADVLDTIPGFEGARPSYTLTTTEAFARGTPRTVLYLWNGVPLNSPQNNQRTLGPYLMLDAIDRVEVVSGPGGVLWGADAFLGIVSISTLPSDVDGSTSEARVSMGAGSRTHAEYRASATVAQRFWGDRVGLRATLGLVTSKGPVLDPGYDVIGGPATAPDPDGTFTVRPGSGPLRNRADLWVPLSLGLDAGGWHLDVLYPVVAQQYTELNDRGHRTDQFVDANGEIVVGDSSRRAENVTLASLTYQKEIGRTSRVTGRAYFTGFEDRWAHQIFEPPGLLGDQLIVGVDRYSGMSPFLHDGAYRYGLGVDMGHDARRWHLILGAELYEEGLRQVLGSLTGGLVSGGEFVRYNAGRRLVTASFVEDEWAITPRVAVKVGGRAQYSPGNYAPLFLGAGALRVGLTDQLNLKVNVAQGFRPPAFEDTLGNDDPYTNPYSHRQSNPDLRPERSLSAESELSGIGRYSEGALRRLAGRVGYQYTRLDDLIVLDSEGVPQNTNRRVIHSLELRADATFRGGHRLLVGYSALLGEDMETGPMRNVPQHRVSVASDVHVSPHLRGFIGLTVSGGVEDLDRRASLQDGMTVTVSTAEVTIDHLPASATVNLGLHAVDLLNDHLDLAIDVSNLFDARHPIADANFDSRQAIFAIPSLGRSVVGSLTWRM